ncbi:MAG: hypothetical protein KIS92_04420 [Planctomycetota bacterium]|nr:hypothetical protein [Planctomycetota bacterium]
MSENFKTYRDVIEWITEQPLWGWTAKYWRLSELIVQLPNRPKNKDVQAVKADAPLPAGILSLGCTGLRENAFDWLGWDFDVGDHGAVLGKDKDGREIRASYPSSDAAVASAMGLWHYLRGAAEVRHSRNGLGCHVRTILPAPIPKEKGVEIARAAVDALGLRADRGPIGRQQFWLWTRRPAHANSFKLIQGEK